MLIGLICMTLFKTSCLHGTCWFHEKTRAGEECRGKMRRFTLGIAQYLGSNTDTWACTRHWTSINREINGFCACALPVHLNGLHMQNISERLLQMFHRIRESVPGYRRGVKWCNNCYKTADQLFKNEPDYHPPGKVKLFIYNTKTPSLHADVY